MGMLDRYKKKGGFIQLLNLIETTSPKAKAEKFLELIKQENPAWETEIRKKTLTLDKIFGWHPSAIMEITPRIPPGMVAYALVPFPEETKAKVMATLGHSERRKAEDALAEKAPTPAEIGTCQNKILTEVRTMISSNELKMDKIDPDMLVPENIEELLASGSLGSTAVMPDSSEALSVSTIGNMASHTPGAGGAVNSEELSLLRKKVVALTQENLTLKNQLAAMTNKLDNIKKAVA